MTELARREDTDHAVAQYMPEPPATALGRWAHDARQASSVAQSLARTPFVPASLRDRNDPNVTAANITAAILTGNELGLEPMAALRSIDVIQGTPATRAVAVRAVVLARGHDMWVVESNATRCVMRGKRQGSEHEQESVWTIDRARALGLVGKDNWKKQPQAMLMARATSELGRLIAPDALLGIPYSVEELDDGDEASAPPVSDAGPTPSGRRTAQRRNRPGQAVARPPVATEDEPAAPEPAFDDERTSDEAAQAEGSEPDAVTQPQLRKIHALYCELKMPERDERLADVSGFLGRDLTSSSDLTKDEAKRLIDDLERRTAKDDADVEQCPVCGAVEGRDEHDTELHEAAGA